MTTTNLAVDAEAPVSVRSGGHSLAGFGTHDSGMVIDLRHLSAVRILDHGSRRVRIGAGASWGAVAGTLQQAGLALTAGDTASVGVGGLMLGGGIGWMVRKYHAGLFWALRGGGGNFGVVISFDCIAQPVSAVHYGTIGYQVDGLPGSALDALPPLVACWRDLMLASDENLTTHLVLVPPMTGQPAMVMLKACYASPDADGAAAALAPFRQLAPVTADSVGVVPCTGVLEEAKMPPGLRFEARNTFFRSLGEAPAASIAELFRAGSAIELRGLGGAFGWAAPDATAFAHRDAEFLCVAGVMLPPGVPQGRAARALAAWPDVAVHGSGAYVGFLQSAAATDIAAAYPAATYERLAAVKRHYDPGNVLRRNHNIRPA